MEQGVTVAREAPAAPVALAGPEDLAVKAERRAREVKVGPPVRAAQAEPRVSQENQVNLDSPANQDSPAATPRTRVACRETSDAARILSTSSVSAKAAPQASNSWATAFTTSEIRRATLRSG